ncbi:MAG: EAL domain-containing protein [Pseudomonadota bacterium]|mgnify:CR=1 FL=1|nr:EAL domain-containing protein [Pseudomonadota bacterium]
MPNQDEAQQSAELRQAFLKYLPKRLETLQKRGRRLCVGGWDINALTLLYQEVQTLAGACGRYGILDSGEMLFGIERLLSGPIENVQLPDPEQTAVFVKLLDGLGKIIARQTAPGSRIPIGDAALRDVGQKSRSPYPTSVQPPAQYWQRWSDAPAPAGAVLSERISIPEAPLPAPGKATPPESAPPVRHAPLQPAQSKRVLHLSTGSELSTEIQQRLEAAGYLVDTLDTIEELKEMLGAYAPAMIIVDTPFGAALESIGELLRVVRSRSSQKVSLVSFAESADVAVRLRAMRAGTDAFIVLPQANADIISRIFELLDAASSSPFRVLIIEDDRSQALFAESILRKAGMETRAVNDPIAALEELDTFNPELILMDLYMPDCDGMELTTLIREREAFINIPIVFLSGEHDEEKRFDALSAGGDDYLEKPIRPKHLISAVTNRVRRARATARRTQTLNPRDPVTGLLDRSYVLERISELMAQEQGAPSNGGVLFLMLDGAHTIRDRIGLTAFDQLLSQAGAFVAQQVRSQDYAARYGDTSFFILLQDLDEGEMLAFAEKLRQSFSPHLFELGDRTITLALSIGLATFAQNFGDTADLLNAAERACAISRSTPDRKTGLFQTAVTQTAEGEEGAIVELIKAALKHDQFQLLFQPIASLRGGGEEQFEVLLRLRGDGGKLFTGSALMPIAARAGLTHAIDRWLLSRAAMVIADRTRDEHRVRLFVSQSIESVGDPQRASWLKQVLDTRRARPEQLILQIDTSDAVARVRQTASFAEQIQSVGAKLCLTQFEPTMANFQLLTHVPADFVKIAARFTGPDGQTPRVRAELRQTITHVRERGIRIVAPRVEDAQCAAALWSTGVDYIQGNFVQAASQDLDFDFAAAAL